MIFDIYPYFKVIVAVGTDSFGMLLFISNSVKWLFGSVAIFMGKR